MRELILVRLWVRTVIVWMSVSETALSSVSTLLLLLLVMSSRLMHRLLSLLRTQTGLLLDAHWWVGGVVARASGIGET